jgi:GTP-binding protein EngB required for normal cell division
MKHNYLNNRDILKEIHKSKTTYCSFLQPEDADYDIILPSIDKINKKNLKFKIESFEVSKQFEDYHVVLLKHKKEIGTLIPP